MPYSFRRILKTLSLSLGLLVCGPIQAVHASSQLEGRISTQGKSNGLFDLRVEIWSNSSTKSQLIQVIDIPRVQVNERCFNFTLDTGIKAEDAKDFKVNIQSREFESWKPYTPAELSKYRST